MGLRVDQYKIVFAEQRAIGLDVWREPLSTFRIPKIFDLVASTAVNVVVADKDVADVRLQFIVQ